MNITTRSMTRLLLITRSNLPTKYVLLLKFLFWGWGMQPGILPAHILFDKTCTGRCEIVHLFSSGNTHFPSLLYVLVLSCPVLDLWGRLKSHVLVPVPVILFSHVAYPSTLQMEAVGSSDTGASLSYCMLF